MLPYTSERLTPVEKAVQKDQERRVCTSCQRMQHIERSGARICLVQHNHDYTPADVLAGRVHCNDYINIKIGRTE